MKYLLPIILLLQVLSGLAQENNHEQIDVLFIGNSLTYFHDMPQKVQNMLDETHGNYHIEQSTYPGMSLSSHLTEIIVSSTKNSISTRKKEEGELTETEKLILKKEWDYIIMQTGTVAVLIPENRENVVSIAIKKIKTMATNPNCKFVIFNTWPSKNTYPKQYCYPSRNTPSKRDQENCSPTFQSLEDELKHINQAYEITAVENNLIRSNNAEKAYSIMTSYPEIELYEDSMHPNENGSFLNACIFYQILTGYEASGLQYVAEIDPEIANVIKDIAK